MFEIEIEGELEYLKIKNFLNRNFERINIDNPNEYIYSAKLIASKKIYILYMRINLINKEIELCRFFEKNETQKIISIKDDWLKNSEVFINIIKNLLSNIERKQLLEE